MNRDPQTENHLSLLAGINDPRALKDLDDQQLRVLCRDIRQQIITTVASTGGHLGSSLGVVELTVALHHVYETPKDILIWDVGHQCYPHKILTGRRDRIRTLRAGGGLSGFTKRAESEYDPFGAAHSSTSISSGLGMAVARDLAGRDNNVIAVIGDGAMTAGMAYEALNHAGGMDDEPNLLVILNDNRMSISEAVGGVTRMLGRMTSSSTLNALREGGKKLLGDKRSSGPARFVRRWEEHWKGMFVPSTLFEEMGFHYTGPIDGQQAELVYAGSGCSPLSFFVPYQLQ